LGSKNVDKIFFLGMGTIVEHGMQDALLSQKGIYHESFRPQKNIITP
jgi:ABC-type multidrug transport system fused ATPase/permease subunit